MQSETLKASWAEKGFLKLPGFYSADQAEMFQQWASELADYPQLKNKWMLYYESSMLDNSKLLCRIENFLEFHPGFKDVLLEERLILLLSMLLNDQAVLFKEKINFKFPGGNGFAAHQDSPAFAALGQVYHVTAMISIDETNPANGCLEFAPGLHTKGVLPQESNGDLDHGLENSVQWEAVPTQPGDLLVFDSYIPHRSSPNRTGSPRRVLFATYNRLSDKDKRNEYYTTKRKYFPPDYEREAGIDYSAANPFNLGNPIK
jgi:hypothetical protein